VISHNVYWLAGDNNYTSLNQMPRATLETTILKKEQVKTETKWTLKFTNKSKHLAFFVAPRLMNDQEEVLPAFWSANYFSLAPGESITASVSASSAKMKGKSRQILVKGWNVEETKISLQKD